MSKCGAHTKKSERAGSIIRLLPLLAIIALVPWAQGQTAQQAAQPPADPGVHSDEVTLDMVVGDRHDKPILDLKPEEIAVTDDGSPVTLTSLRLIKGEAESGDHAISLVFDALSPELAKRVRIVARDLLQAVPKSGFSLTVLYVNDRLRVQQGFTSDREAIKDAVSAVTTPAKSVTGATIGLPEQQIIAEVQKGVDPSGKPVSVKDRAQAKTLLSAIEDAVRIERDEHADASLAGLLALVQSQQKSPQRKAVIYFTPGKQIDSRAKEMLQSIESEANRAGVSIYVIDLNAIEETAIKEMAREMSPDYNIGQTGPLQNQMPGGSSPTNDDTQLATTLQAYNTRSTSANYADALSHDKTPLQSMSEHTGGSLIASEDAMRKPFARMIQDLTTYYEATYVPSVKEYDGEFRPIAVKPLRAGLNIRTSAGYFALPPGSEAGTRPFELPLLKILSQSQLPTDLSFHAAVLHFGDLHGGNANTVVIEAPLSEMKIHEDASSDLYLAHLSIVAQIKDKNGTVMEHFSEDISPRGALEQIEKAKSEVITFQRHFTAPPGKYVLEAVVLDHNNEKAGAQRVDFDIAEVPDPPSLSEMVLVRNTEPLLVKQDPLDPLQQGDSQVVPNISGQTRPGLKAVSAFFIAHQDFRATDAAVLNLDLLKDGKSVRHMPIATLPAGSSAATSYLLTLPVGKLSDGVYELKASITQGPKTATSSTSFTLTGGGAADDETEAADVDPPVPVVESRATGTLPITFPATTRPRPGAEELKSLIEGATHHAISYTDSLPNFICVEVTNRSVDPKGKGAWEHKDQFTELLTYHNHEEKRRTLAVNGSKSDSDMEDSTGSFSIGEFGGLLQSVFEPSSKADFQWKEAGMLGEDPIQVFEYHVLIANSSFTLKQGGLAKTVGFHGQVFVDSTTRSVRRLSIVADDIPQKFPIRAASFNVDYDYFAINSHDYLLPASGHLMVQTGHRQASLNEFEFRDYRRFGSNAKILNAPVEAAP